MSGEANYMGWASYDNGGPLQTMIGWQFESDTLGDRPYIYDLAYRVMGTAATVPEPGTWTMLIAGFGLVGAAARCRRPAARPLAA